MGIELTRLKLSLHEAMEKWINEQCINDDWGMLGYVPDNLSDTMTTSAFSILESTKGLNDYFEKEQMFK